MREYSQRAPIIFGAPLPKPIEAASLVLTALLGGFIAATTPDSRGWIESYNARHVFLKFAQTSNLEAIETREVYEVSEGQNLSLQKTVLGLPEGQSYSVGMEIRDDDGNAVYSSPEASITTLTYSDALAINYSE